MVAQAVAHRTTNREVPGSNPAGSWAFFSFHRLSLLFPISQSVARPKSGPSRRCNTTGFSTFQEKKIMPSSGELV